MPFIVSSESETTEVSSTYDKTIDSIEVDDLIIVSTAQTNGSTDQSVSSGWTSIGDTTAVGSVRARLWYRIATSTSHSITVTGGTQNWAANVVVVRGADTTTPFDVTPVRSSFSSASSFTPTSLTTTNNNCLILHLISSRIIASYIPNDVNAMHQLSYNKETVMTAVASYRNQYTAGLVPSVLWLSSSAGSTNNNQTFVIAIRDANPSSPKMMYDQDNKYEIINYLSGSAAITTTDSFSIHESITVESFEEVTPTTIDGLDVLTGYTPTVTATYQNAASPWGQFLNVRTAVSAIDTTGRWVGMSYARTIDMSGKIFSILFMSGFTVNSGAKGFVAFFEDSGGNWEAFRMTRKAGLSITEVYPFVFAPGETTPIDSSGTLDWTDITRIGFAYHRTGTSTSSMDFRLKWAVLYDNPTIFGGCTDRPITPSDFKTFIDCWGNNVAIDGTNFVTSKVPIFVGDSSTETHFDSTATGYQTPFPPDGTFSKQFWQVPEDKVMFTVQAGADDVITQSKGLFINNNQQNLDFTGTVAGATFDFQGQVYIGTKVTGNDNVIFNGVTFDRCYLIDLKGGGLSDATVSNSAVSTAVKADDPGNISNTTFISAGTGHAIELTTPGTYDFEGNSFTGYGADTTTDAAIYNNSGGAITLTIPSGDDTPTIRNGAGASTTIVQPTDNQSVTISGATAGSRIQIYDLTSDTELYNGTPTFPYTWTDTNPYVADREIRLRVAYVNGTSAKQFIDTVIGTSTSTTPAVAYLVNQTNDTVYNANAIDGSTITTVTIDDNNLLIEVDTGTISVKDIYAYEMYWLFTATGIADEGKAVVAVDVANYAIYGFKVKNVSSPSVPLTITGGWVTDGDTGVAIDIVDTSGGTIFLAPDHVVAYATGSGVTPGDVTDIATEVWDTAKDYLNTSNGDVLTPL